MTQSDVKETKLESDRAVRRRIRLWLGIFICGLVFSGITAFPLQWELEVLGQWLGIPARANPAEFTGLQYWIATVRNGLQETYGKFPFMAYGTDWLAFAHIVIAIFFIGPLVRPEQNRWVVTAGMIACGLVLVLALVCGPIRGIPVYWRLIDCSFGVLGFIPLWLCWRDMKELEKRRKQ